MSVGLLRKMLLLILLGMFHAPSLAHSGVEPLSRLNEASWKTRFELLNQRAAATGSRARLVFIGDSITEGWEQEGKDVWARYYAHRGALNLGIGGDQTRHVLWRLEHGNIDGLKPELIVLMIGTNNISWVDGHGQRVPQIVDGVRAVIAKLRAKLPQSKILLLSIFPRGEYPNHMRGDVLQVNQILRREADGHMIHWSDFGERYVADDGTIPLDLMPDSLHLSEKGYVIWAEAIESQVKRILNEK